MGVDMNLYLPVDVRVDDVAMVAGLAAGLTGRRDEFERCDGWHAEVAGATVKYHDSYFGADIILKGELADGDDIHHCSYHAEISAMRGGKYERLIIARSTAFWISVCEKVGRFFGGKLVYNDCGGDSERGNFKVFPRPRKCNRPDSDKPWERLQVEILAVTAVTIKDMERNERHAAYPTIGDIRAALAAKENQFS